MKRLVVVTFFIFLVVVAVFAQMDATRLIIGNWYIQGDLPARSIEFKENGQCFIAMRDKSVIEYSYRFTDDGFFFLGTNGYRFEFRDGNTKFVMTPAFGEGGHVVVMIRSK